MPALNFKKEFAPKVESGEKRMSIRPIGKRRYRVGDMLFLYTGLRTKACRKLGEAVCAEVVPTIMKMETNYLLKRINFYGERPTCISYNKFVKADGFNNIEEFEEFFITQYKLKPGDIKEMIIIKW